MERSPLFWQALDRLFTSLPLRIDRPKGSSHPKFPEMIYPLDYGYLEGFSAIDGREWMCG